MMTGGMMFNTLMGNKIDIFQRGHQYDYNKVFS